MYTDRVKEYDIDLSLPESHRWLGVIKEEQATTRKLFHAAVSDFDEITWLHHSPILRGIFNMAYKMFGGLYSDEIESWAIASGVSASMATLLNCTYELCAYGEYIGDWAMSPFGCTAGVHWIPGHGMVHVRSMDWPIEEIGRATRVFRFHDGGRWFISVGVSGMVSVLSGMVPGAYSATINWAPACEPPSMKFGPSFLLREVLASCDTYQEAVKALSEEVLAAPVFFVVCGTERGEGCVIERSPTEYAIREWNGRPLVHANHYMTNEFKDRNRNIRVEDEDGSVFQDSLDRARTLQKAMRNRLSSLQEASACLDQHPVCNDQSYQQMMFCPAEEEYQVWRWV